jgi:DNA-binding MarR family transcriptional regulator
MINVRKIVRAINLESKSLEKNFGISIPQLLTLKYLNECDNYSCSLKDLRGVLSLNPSTITGIATRLENKGYIARLPNPNDKRSTPIVLTSEGLDVIKKTDESLHERISKNLEGLSQEEYDKIVKSFDTIISFLEIDSVEASPIITGPTDI